MNFPLNLARIPILRTVVHGAAIGLFCVGAVAAIAAPPKPAPASAAPLAYNRDIRPILSENCFSCHGSDSNKRQAGLRLDIADIATGKLASGGAAIVPGNAGASELMTRVLAKGPLQMPPATSGKHITPVQIATLRRWIAQGAHYQQHWAFVKPEKAPLPVVKAAAWAHNPVDRFVLANLERVGLKPQPTADRRTLVRRLSLDLTGIPPTIKEVNAFIADRSPDAYIHLVDRLLASPHYGERLASYWLDLVRYADTDGYHGDRNRNVSPFRDYVINAFNSDMPFDRFTKEQIAGDLLPNPTLEQRVASGYNRLNMITREGGAQDKEYIAKYASERVRTTTEAWMGATLGCAECHDHKFDPYTARDFYSFESFFADLQQVGVYPNGGDDLDPWIEVPTPQQAASLAVLDTRITAVKADVESKMPAALADQARWEEALHGVAPKDMPKAAAAVLAVPAASRTDAQRTALLNYYKKVAPALQPMQTQLASLETERGTVDKTVPHMMVSVAVTPRVVHLLPRGNWMDETGPVVTPAAPHFLPQIPAGEPANRLALAKWLVSRDNPLTARCFVNRMWMLLFGAGIVRTPGDFGTQGAWPTHPELLDWLSVQFMESGWDVKALIRQIVTSNTYKQSSETTPALRERDPYNMLLARQSAFRIDAEFVRDNALSIAGLLSTTVGGRSVFPYQPAGYWNHCNTFAGPLIYKQDHGDDLYRRGLYTYWKRTFMQPSLLAFDAPTREECTVERDRSNTPLQALVLMNDPTYVEAARVFAEHIIQTGGASPSARIDWAFQRAVARHALPAESRILTDVYTRRLADFKSDPKATDALIHAGESPLPAGMEPTELAAWTSVARVILNLSETITRD